MWNRIISIAVTLFVGFCIYIFMSGVENEFGKAAAFVTGGVFISAAIFGYFARKR